MFLSHVHFSQMLVEFDALKYYQLFRFFFWGGGGGSWNVLYMAKLWIYGALSAININFRVSNLLSYLIF